MSMEKVNGFVDRIILAAAYSNVASQGKPRSMLSYLEGKVASLVDLIFNTFSSSYHARRTLLRDRIKAGHGNMAKNPAQSNTLKKADLVKEKTLGEPQLTDNKPTLDKNPAKQPLLDEEIANKESENDPDQTWDGDDLNNLFQIFDEDPAPIEEKTEEPIVQENPIVVQTSPPKQEELEQIKEEVKGKDKGENEKPVVDQEETEQGKVGHELEEPVVTQPFQEPILKITEPAPDTVIDIQKLQERIELENKAIELENREVSVDERPDVVIDIPEEVLTEEEFFEMVQDVWNQDSEKLVDADPSKKKQFAQILYSNPGALAGLLYGLQVLDYWDKHPEEDPRWSSDLMDDAFGEMETENLFDTTSEIESKAASYNAEKAEREKEIQANLKEERDFFANLDVEGLAEVNPDIEAKAKQYNEENKEKENQYYEDKFPFANWDVKGLLKIDESIEEKALDYKKEKLALLMIKNPGVLAGFMAIMQQQMYLNQVPESEKTEETEAAFLAHMENVINHIAETVYENFAEEIKEAGHQ